MLASRLTNKESSHISGEPRLYKTSFLDYLAEPVNQVKLYGKHSKNFIFSRINGQTLSDNLVQSQFWALALAPIKDQIELLNPSEEFTSSFNKCIKTANPHELFRFFKLLALQNKLLVLILDEFDYIVSHPTLKSIDFFGTLRALSTNTDGLVIIASSRQSIEELENQLSEINRIGSPFFNNFISCHLSVLSQRDIALLLQPYTDHYSIIDRQFIVDVSGGTPFLVRLAASEIWRKDNSNQKADVAFYQKASERINYATQHYFSDIWRGWTPQTRIAIASIAFLQTPNILGEISIQTTNIDKYLPYILPEIRELIQNGWVSEHRNTHNRFRINQEAVLWWLSSELVRTIRDDKGFEDWLLGKKLVGGIFPQKDFENFRQMTKYVAGLLKNGVSTLMEAYIHKLTSAT